MKYGRIIHPYCKKMMDTLKYYENLTRASRSNTGTSSRVVYGTSRVVMPKVAMPCIDGTTPKRVSICFLQVQEIVT